MAEIPSVLEFGLVLRREKRPSFRLPLGVSPEGFRKSNPPGDPSEWIDRAGLPTLHRADYLVFVFDPISPLAGDPMPSFGVSEAWLTELATNIPPLSW